jgi:CMP-N-acetylneuraminic acid synthetase
MSDVLAIIPARVGSKGIPNKNFRMLSGESPVKRAAQCVLAAGITRAFITTDHPTFLGIVRDTLNTPSLQRPEALAKDDTPMIDVVRDVLARIPGPDDQIILLVQPTQPLREPKHLKDAIRLMENPHTMSVVSVVDTESPERMMYIDSTGHLTSWDDHGVRERRQSAAPGCRRDGTVYGFRRRNAGLTREPWYLYPCVPLIVPKSETCELDTPDDWAIAEIRLAAKEALLRA